MRHHLACVTVDADPDGLSGPTVNRRSLSWEGLEGLRRLPEWPEGGPVLAGRRLPVSWFVRADGQLRQVLGSSLYLLEHYADFWDEVHRRGDELGWHPHLYRQRRAEDAPTLITDPAEAADELGRLWEDLGRWPLRPTSFRNGEGWHSAATLAAVEAFGIRQDSTAIPGRTGGHGHPLDWRGTPNRPYHPGPVDIRRPGPARPLLEVPMNTWWLRAPYDDGPRLRYMNPAVHEALFAAALEGWEGTRPEAGGALALWVLICHPDEVAPAGGRGADLLYARSAAALARNLAALAAHIERAGQTVEFTTLSAAAARWRQHEEGRP